MSDRVRHQWTDKPFRFRLHDDGALWFLDESMDGEWWEANTSGAFDAELLGEILRLRGLLEEAIPFVEEPAHAPALAARIRQALNREEEDVP